MALQILQYVRYFVIFFLFYGDQKLPVFVECTISDSADNRNESLENRNFIIVSTADGELSAFDPDNGEIVWSVRTDPGELISSSLKKLEINERGKKIRLVPSLDGNLFKFDGKKLEPLPVSAEALLRNSYKVGDNLLIIGGKEITGYGINMKTGEVHYVCKAEGCKQMSYVSPEETILIIERHTQTVRAVSARNGDDQWNFRVSEHRISVSQGLVGHSLPADHDNAAFKSKALLLPPNEKKVISFQTMAKVDMLKGVIGMKDQETDTFKWSQKLSHPIVDVWQVKDGTVESYDLLSESAENISDDDSISSHSLLLVGSYEENLYVKKSDSKKYNSPTVARAQFYPVLSDATRTELEESGLSESSSLAIMISDSNFPYVAFSYSEDTLTAANNTHCFLNQRDRFEILKDEVFSILYHWKEVIIFSCILTVLVNALACMVCQKIKRRSKLFDISALSSTSVNSEVQCNSYSELQECGPGDTEYLSRYLTDFEPIACLGRGGYGVVFEAKNKIDDCCYAVKRIKLTTRDAANDRIMREVKALAKLDHAGIVRYFNSWVENPPQNWQDAKDKELEKFRLGHSSEVSDISSRSKTILENTSSHRIGFVNPLKPFDHEILDYSRHRYSWKSTDESAVEKDFDVSHNSRTSYTTSYSKKKSEGDLNHEKTFDPKKPKKCDMFLYIQMQLCQRKSLKDWLLLNDDKRDRDEVLHIFYQIVSAVEYVHQCGLMHRDLKPSNIFFSLDGDVKIGDFGLVAPMLCNDSNFDKPILKQSQKKKLLLKHSDLVGTQLYMSPEQVQRSLYNHKVDIFSLGMIFYELLMPFKTQSERIKVLTKVKEQKFPKKFREKYDCECALASKLLSHNPDDRPTASEIKEHPILEKFHQISFTVPKQSPLHNVSFSSAK